MNQSPGIRITANPIKQLRTILKDNFHANVVLSELEIHIGLLEKDVAGLERILRIDRVIYKEKKKIFTERNIALKVCVEALREFYEEYDGEYERPTELMEKAFANPAVKVILNEPRTN